MFAFERDAPDSPLTTYGEALWWTAMMTTTIGSDYFPQTAEGRVLCFILAIYAFAVFGYVTATLATFFIGRDAADEESEVAGSEQVNALRDDIAALRAEVRALTSALNSSSEQGC
jgi:voltage-gated potassium channel